MDRPRRASGGDPSSSAVAETPPASLRGARVAFTGRLASMTRREAHAIVREAGGTPTSSVSGRTTHLVIGAHGWPLKADGDVSAKLQQAERQRARRGTMHIVPETRFLEMVGLRDRAPELRKTYPIDRVADLVGVDARTIERWEHLGLVRSDDGAYDFQDIVSLQTVAGLVRDGVSVPGLQRSLEALASVVPGTERPLAQLRIIATDTGDLLARIGEALVAPDGQQLLDFDAPAEAAGDEAGPAAIDAGAAPPGLTVEMESVDELLERATWLEEEERYDEAARAYRRAIVRAPDRTEAYYNLGNVLRMTGRAEAAEELYRLALAVDPENELAWYNLADVQEEVGREAEAIESLRRAIDAEPTFADAHFNLASVLEAGGDIVAAREHWRAYVSLDPNSEWATLARERL
jgi:DNA-binding transcriptional MerR regulator